MTGKIGRPKSNNPKNRKITIKVTAEEFAEIERVAKSKNLTKSTAILKGIQLLKSEK